MSRKTFNCFAFLLCLYFNLFNPLFGQVFKASNLEEVKQAVERLSAEEKANLLLIFDVDDTLITSVDALLKPKGEAYLKEHLDRYFVGGRLRERMRSLPFLSSKRERVEPNLDRYLQEWKERGYKMIALTAITTGSCEHIADMLSWRMGQLAELGISFAQSFPQLADHTFVEFKDPSKPNKSLPKYTKGVVATAEEKKGEVLLAFLRMAKIEPSYILFVDDRLSYIETVEAALDQTQIPHLSFHYTASSERPQQANLTRERLQLRCLVEQEVWLSDQEADQLIERNEERCVFSVAN